MSRSDWQSCDRPDEMLQFLLGKVSRKQLVDFVRRCWDHVEKHVEAPPHEITVVEQFAAIADQMSDMDAATYAYEASLKAAGWAPNLKTEQRQQAALLRRLVPYPGV